MPAVWEQHCYDSVLAGKAVSAEDHRLAVNTADVMGWETFREFHDCYLHTDVLALADVTQSGLDPIHYVTLPGAAWDAMLRHSARETPIHLITDEQAYRDVRASVMGGLSCIFQPFAQANNPELGEEDYNPEEPVSWISYLDFNAMYPAAMTLPMPNGPCVAVALPEDNAARLSWLHETCLSSLNWEFDAEEVSYLLLVDYDFPSELHDHLDSRMKVGKGLYGPHTADMAERLGLSPSPCEKLVPFLGMHVLEAAQGLPLRLQPLHGGLHGAQAQRAEAAQDGGERGRREAHPERHLRPLLHEPRQVQEHERLRGPGQVRAGRGQELRDELRAPDQRLGGVPGLRGDAQDGPQQGLHERAHPSRRPHAAALQAHDGEGHYLHMRRLFPKMRLLFTDTDSVMVQIFELQDPLHAMAWPRRT